MRCVCRQKLTTQQNNVNLVSNRLWTSGALSIFPKFWSNQLKRNDTGRSNKNFPEQTVDLLRYSTFSIPNGGNRNYPSICIKLPYFPFCCLFGTNGKKPFHLTQDVSEICDHKLWFYPLTPNIPGIHFRILLV